MSSCALRAKISDAVSVRYHAQGPGQHSETDRKDSIMLARYGIGKGLSSCLMAALRSRDFSSTRQAAAFFGRVPITEQSSTSVRKWPPTRQGWLHQALLKAVYGGGGSPLQPRYPDAVPAIIRPGKAAKTAPVRPRYGVHPPTFG